MIGMRWDMDKVPALSLSPSQSILILPLQERKTVQRVHKVVDSTVPIYTKALQVRELKAEMQAVEYGCSLEG
jgi:hypothetical protein